MKTVGGKGSRTGQLHSVKITSCDRSNHRIQCKCLTLIWNSSVQKRKWWRWVLAALWSDLWPCWWRVCYRQVQCRCFHRMEHFWEHLVTVAVDQVKYLIQGVSAQTMTVSMLLSGRTVVYQYSTHLEQLHISLHLVGRAVVASPLTRMDSYVPVTSTVTAFKYSEPTHTWCRHDNKFFCWSFSLI